MIRFFQLLLLTSLALAGWMAWQALGHAQVFGCTAGADCDSVLSSSWAYAFGLPVSAWGAALYLVTLLASLLRWERPLRVGAFTILFGAAWFFGLQAFLLQKYCPLCCSIHGLASIAAIGLLWTTSSVERSTSAKLLWPGFAAFALTGIWISAQLFAAPSEHSASVQVSPTGADGQAIQAPALFGKTPQGLILLPGAVGTVIPGQIPTLGQVSSQHPTLLVLHDWTCEHCRALHRQLLSQKEPSQIYFIPASTDKAGQQVHRMMQTLFLADPASYTELEKQFLEPESQVTVQAIEEAAIKRLGERRWERMLAALEKEVDKQIQLAAAVMAHTATMLPNSSLPQVLSPAEILIGTPSDKTLAAFIQRAPQAPVQTAPALAAKAPTAPTIPQQALPQGTAVATSTASQVPAAAAQRPLNQSRIEFESTSIDAAPVKQGETAMGTFRFKNSGTEPLTIYAVNTGCGCTAATDWQKAIEPGQSGSITVRFNSAGRSIGQDQRHIQVVSSAANAQPGGDQVHLNVTIQPPTKSEPEKPPAPPGSEETRPALPATPNKSPAASASNQPSSHQRLNESAKAASTHDPHDPDSRNPADAVMT